MEQRINLYQPAFHKQYLLFSFRTLILVVALSLLCMAGVYTYGQWQRHQLVVNLESLQQQHAFLQQQLLAMEKKLPPPVASQLLEQTLKQLLESYSTGQGLLQRVRALIEGNRTGFSGYLEGLARQVERGVWLTEIEIAQAGGYLALQGSVTQPELVPQLLQKLRDEEVFRGKAFEVMDLNRPDAEQGRIDFALLTKEGER